MARQYYTSVCVYTNKKVENLELPRTINKKRWKTQRSYQLVRSILIETSS
uniref:Uncharacterized protein n=1 Tax=Arundo donax TaxID=35708 RepID=A0A0A9AWJ6_ARUDO